MLRRLLLPLALAACLLADGARADPYTEHFTAVRARLAEMRDALVPPLTRAQTKRRSLLLRVVDAIDQISDSFAQDAATARTIAIAAERDLADDAELHDLVVTLVGDLADDVAAENQDADGRIAALAPSAARAKAERALAKLRSALDAVAQARTDDDVRQMARELARAVASERALAAALAVAEAPDECRDPPPKGTDLVCEGPGGYREVLHQSRFEPLVSSGFGRTFLIQGGGRLSLTLTLLAESSGMDAGDDVLVELVRVDDQGVPNVVAPSHWERRDGSVRVARTTAKRITLCLDIVVPGVAAAGTPGDLSVRGTVIFKR